MKALSPTEYAEEVWGGSVTDKTIRNWINKGIPLKGVDRVETTPTGRYVLFMKEEVKSNIDALFEQMKRKVA
ncbi:hypothetical protein CA267_002025 [Alteromonas pelagimontana]|uniref:Uncharacterized protein n=1 Tax=Alteromonas pelagimontana TaxID=1858656 RepID=A0A6M4M8Y9_9ALTE|nr:hypothetical protein [Alteromonas pelagimontana]QJR79661.1 hypothetical protein CA267_002025 [Alteromonas pelagimontana]